MTEKMERRGVSAPHSLEPDILQQVLVRDVFVEDPNALSIDNTVKEAREWIKNNGAQQGQATAFVLVDKDGVLAGTVRRKTIFEKHNDDLRLGSLPDIAGPYTLEDSRVSLAVDLMAKHDIDLLPVVNSEKEKVVTGVLSHKEVFDAYSRRRNDAENYQRTISLKRRGIKIILKGMQFLGKG